MNTDRQVIFVFIRAHSWLGMGLGAIIKLEEACPARIL
jgi:hypothetical protein